MAMGSTGGGEGLSSDINVTPLIDVLLVLLIIFMITQPMSRKAFDVQTPKQQTGRRSRMYGRGGVGGTAVPCPLRRPYVFVRPRLPSVGYLSLVTAPSPPTQRPPLPGLRLPLGRRRLGTGALVSMVVHGLIIVLLIARGRELLQRLPGAPGQGGGGNDGAGRPQINFFTLPVAGPAAVDVPAVPAVIVSDLRTLPPLKLDLPPLDVPRAPLLAATAAGAVSPGVGPGAGGGQGGGAGGG